MSLLEFISKDLMLEQKEELIKDKAVCLCIFRIQFTALEQQIIYRIIFQDLKFSINSISDMLNINGFKETEESDKVGASGTSVIILQAEAFLAKLKR